MYSTHLERLDVFARQHTKTHMGSYEPAEICMTDKYAGLCTWTHTQQHRERERVVRFSNISVPKTARFAFSRLTHSSCVFCGWLVTCHPASDKKHSGVLSGLERLRILKLYQQKSPRERVGIDRLGVKRLQLRFASSVFTHSSQIAV